MSVDKEANYLSPSTVVNKALHVIKPAKSMGKVLGVGTTKTLKPGGLGKLPSLKNPVSATGTTKGFNSGNSGLNITKAAHENGNGNGEQMNSHILGNAYTAGVKAAFAKIAMPMPPQMPMEQVQQQMQPGQMQPMQAQQAPPMEAPVAAPMQDIQQDMAAQASPQELQDVQNSGITSGDIASAAKVIQTMAEMKATADMAGMQPIDQSGVQAPGMSPAPAPQG